MDFNEKYELCINDLIYHNYYRKATQDLASTIYFMFHTEVIKISKERVYKKDQEKYYSEKVAEYEAHIERYAASDIFKGNDFVSFTQDVNLYFSKSKSAIHHISEYDEFYFKIEYPPLFLLKTYNIEPMEVIDFLKYQIAVNFENDINKFKEFYTSLKYYSMENDCLKCFDKRNEQIIEYLESTADAKNTARKNIINVKHIAPVPEKIEEVQEMDTLQKMIFFHQIGFLKYIQDKNPNNVSSFYGELLNNYINAKEATLSRYYRSLINDSRNYLNTRSKELFIKSLPDKEKQEELLKNLIQTYPALPSDTFWIDFGLTLE